MPEIGEIVRDELDFSLTLSMDANITKLTYRIHYLRFKIKSRANRRPGPGDAEIARPRIWKLQN